MDFFYQVRLPIEIPLSVIIIFSNIIGILAITSSREKIVSRYFIINLSVSDLLVGCSIIDGLIIDSKVFGSTKILCLLKYFLYISTCGASLNSIAVIAVDRYIAIVYPHKYSKLVTKRGITCTLVIVWAIALILAAILFFWNKYESNKPCEYDDIVPSALTNMIFAPWFFIIWFSIIILYFLIWSKVRSHAQKLQISRQRNTDQAVLMIIGCFTLCWLPSAILDFFPIPHEYEVLMNISMSWLAFLNCAINPFIYTLKIPVYRHACYRLFGQKFQTNLENV